MKREKYYSTLKVQQEMLKDTYNGKRITSYAYDESRWFYDGKFDTAVWFMYKGFALYRSDKTLLDMNKYKKMNLQQILHDLSDAYIELEVKYYTPILEFVDTKRNELIILEDEKGNEHKINKKFLDIVNLNPYKCRYFIKENSKPGIITVRDEEKTLLCGIMEVK